MVNTTSTNPRFNLELIQLAARRSDGLSITPRARQDAENLGHSFADLRSLICRLLPSDFDHVWVKRDAKNRLITDVQGREIAMDVYFPWIVAPNGDECRVYLKLTLAGSTIAITSIQSFHQQRK
jgi:hypothetical protein